MNIQANTLFLGIDAGGTHCRVRLEDQQGELLGVGHAATGHPVHGLDVVSNNVLSATDEALSMAGMAFGQYDNIIAAGGYAGAHLSRFHNLIESWQHPFKMHYTTTDLHTACSGALAGQDGGVVIMGTGFSAMSHIAGKSQFIGGHGFLLGDVACGGWLGLQAVKMALASHDGMLPHSQVVEVVESTFNARGAQLADKMITAKPNDFARCAKGIFTAAENNDEAANELVKQALADGEAVIQKLIEHGCEKVALYGSVGKRLQPLMSKDVASVLVEPKGSAEQGAIRIARQCTHMYN